MFQFANQRVTGPALLGCLSGAGRIWVRPMGPRGGVVTQRSAKQMGSLALSTPTS